MSEIFVQRLKKEIAEVDKTLSTEFLPNFDTYRDTFTKKQTLLAIYDMYRECSDTEYHEQDFRQKYSNIRTS